MEKNDTQDTDQDKKTPKFSFSYSNKRRIFEDPEREGFWGVVGNIIANMNRWHWMLVFLLSPYLLLPSMFALDDFVSRGILFLRNIGLF